MRQPISPTFAEKPKRLVNLGCGTAFHPDWINIDFHGHGKAVLGHDLRLGIPLPDASVDVVYHSHLLEHFSCVGGRAFLAECLRVLRPGGLLRLAVPDLENIARAYITALDDAKAGAPGAEDRHQWMIIELVDQMTRTHSGGVMAEFWRRDPLPEEPFILSRTGMELVNFRRSPANAPVCARGALPAPDIDFLQGGELHRWMYDEASLRHTLEQTGFTGIARQAHDSSLSPDILRYALDAGPDGTVRKPDSLFMEALKPHAAEKPRPMPVALFSTTETGGAGTVALRLHTYLPDAGIDSHLYVAQQHIRVNNLHLPPMPGQRVLPVGRSAACLSGLGQAQQRNYTAVAAYPLRPQGLEFFSADTQCAQLAALPLQEDFTVINLHWVANFFSVAANLDALQGRPVVWTLHDMRPFTGGCHYAGGCRGFTEHCGHCPQLGSRDPEDLSFRTWRAQMAAYRKLDLHIVTPSAWLAGEAEKSSLLRRFPVRIIPNPHPLDSFRPLNRATIRAALGIAPEELVLLFAAEGLGNTRKGGAYLLETLHALATLPLAAHARLLLLGNHPPEALLHTGVRTETAGHVETPEQMAAIYNAADAVLVPSLEDNSPNVICEALGCGTPVVAFATGGIPEMLRDRETGFLAPVRDAAGLLAGIQWAAQVKNDEKTRLRCRAFALETWNAPARARDYADLFRELRDRSEGNEPMGSPAHIPAGRRSAGQAGTALKIALPRQTPSLLLPKAMAKLEKTLQSRQIVAHYARAQLADVRADFRNIPQIGMYRCEASDLVHFYPLIVGKSSLYKQLQRHSWYYLAQKREYHLACGHVRPGDKVLEIGCGQGHFAAFLSGASYTGLEYNEQAVAACRDKGLNVLASTLESFTQGNEERFDMVCAFQVLEHVPEPRAFIASCLSCLKPGGRLLLSVPAEDSFAGLVPNYCLNLPPHHITRWSDKALLALRDIFNLRELRLEPMQLESVHHAHYYNSLAGYEACRKLGVDHTLVEMDLWDKICELSTALLPGIQKRLVENLPDIRGHDVLIAGIKSIS